jgi:hypothetical protein
VHQIKPQSFPEGRDSSLDQFLEMVMDPQQNSSETLPTLFAVHEDQDFSCPNHPGQKENLREEQNISAIIIDKSTFQLNNIPTTDPAQLLLW